MPSRPGATSAGPVSTSVARSGGHDGVNSDGVTDGVNSDGVTAPPWPTVSKWIAPALLVSGLMIGVVLPVLAAWWAGSLSIPHNDAWSYSLIGQTFARTGRVELLGFNRMFLIGQFAVLGPLARWIEVQHLFVALLAGVGLFAIYDLLRPFTGPRRAAFAVLTVALWPGFGLLATSFMGDVPALAGAFACLAIGQRAIRGHSVPLLIAAVVLGLWAITTREQALFAPIAVLIVFGATTARRHLWRPLLWAIGAAFVFAVLALALRSWRMSLPFGDHFSLTDVRDPRGAAEFATQATTRLALGALAAAFVAWRNPLRAKLASGIGLAVGGWIAIEAFRLPGDAVLLGNYLGSNGAYPSAYAATAPLFSAHTWTLLGNLAILAVPIVAIPFARSVRRAPPLLATFGSVLAVVLVAERWLQQDVFDRSILMLLPVVVGIVLLPTPEPRPTFTAGVHGHSKVNPWRVLNWTLAGLACITMGGVTARVTLDGLTRDAQVWKVANRLVQQGTPRSVIDGGMDWIGFQSHRPVLGKFWEGEPWLGFYWEKFHRRPGCLVVTTAPIPGVPVVERLPYKRFLISGNGTVYVSQTSPCPRGRYRT